MIVLHMGRPPLVRLRYTLVLSLAPRPQLTSLGPRMAARSRRQSPLPFEHCLERSNGRFVKTLELPRNFERPSVSLDPTFAVPPFSRAVGRDLPPGTCRLTPRISRTEGFDATPFRPNLRSLNLSEDPNMQNQNARTILAAHAPPSHVIEHSSDWVL